MQPVIKWTGSKRHIVKTVASLLPVSNQFIDPFVGGGSILPYIKSKNIICGDLIPELVILWRLIKHYPELTANEYRRMWDRFQIEGSDYYYYIRRRFNEKYDGFSFLFLSRTCANGLIRFNKDGKFNTSVHHGRPGIHPDRLEKIILQWNKTLKPIDFFVADYREMLARVKRYDVVFLDPPYVGSKGMYYFDDFQHDELYGELNKLSHKGVYWLMTLGGNDDNKVPKGLYKRAFAFKGKSTFPKLSGKSKIATDIIYMNY